MVILSELMFAMSKWSQTKEMRSLLFKIILLCHLHQLFHSPYLALWLGRFLIDAEPTKLGPLSFAKLHAHFYL